MKLGSLFDGVGGFPKIAQELGIAPIWASEIEPFPIKVTKTHFPSMAHLGDITKINGAEIEPVDIITGGSPCQDLSVAGKRAGLEGQRSGLFMEMIRIIKEMRNADKLRIERRRDTKIWDRNDTFIESGKAGVHSEYRNTNAISTGCGAGETADIEGRESQHGFCGTNQPLRPRFVVWENVPGAFSSNNGEDFRAVIEEFCKIADETVTIPRPAKGKWNTAGCVVGNGFSFAWRTIDAQFWGVAQRRRRIYAVLDIGGQCASEIFLEPQSVSGHIAESRETREGIAADAQRCTPKTMLIRSGCEGGGKGALIQDNKSATLATGNHQTLFEPERSVGKAIVIENHPSDSRVKLDESGTVQTLTTRMGTGGGNVPMVAISCASKQISQNIGYDVAMPVMANDYKEPQIVCGAFKAEQSADARGIGWQEQCSPTLQANVERSVGKAVGYDGYQHNNWRESEILGPLTTEANHVRGGTPLCLQGSMAVVETYSIQRTDEYKDSDKASTISRRDYKSATDLVVGAKYSVRRLTPLECERLQGFPDYYTDIPGASDSARYKALGNSVALPCVRHILGTVARILRG